MFDSSAKPNPLSQLSREKLEEQALSMMKLVRRLRGENTDLAPPLMNNYPF
jgi:hypothetical protein